MALGTIVCLFLVIYTVGCNNDFDIYFDEYTRDCTCEQKVRLLTVNYTNPCTEYKVNKVQREPKSDIVHMQKLVFPYDPAANSLSDNYTCAIIATESHGNFKILKFTILIDNTDGVYPTKQEYSYLSFAPENYPGHEIVVGSLYGRCAAYHRAPVVMDKDGQGIISCHPFGAEPRIDSTYVATVKQDPSEEELQRYQKPIDDQFGPFAFKRIEQICKGLKENHESY